MIIANRGGHSQASTGASDVLNELAEDRILYKRIQALLAEVGNTMIDCTCPESYTYPAELTYGINVCNNSKAELFYSIHFNSAVGAFGSEVCIHPNSKAGVYGERVLANLAKLGFHNRGLKDRTNLGELSSINCPSMIIEVCFVQNPDATLYKKLGVEKVARAIANGIDNRVNLEAGVTQKEDKKKVKNLVVYNNYVDKRSAERLAEFLQCPTLDASQVTNFDYSCVETVIGVGGGVFNPAVKTVLKGETRDDTVIAVLKYMKKL